MSGAKYRPNVKAGLQGAQRSRLAQPLGTRLGPLTDAIRGAWVQAVRTQPSTPVSVF